MKPQNLLQKAQEVVTTGNRSNPRYQNIGAAQREQLTASAMRDAGAHAYEYITNSGFLDSIAGTLIIALEAKGESRKEQLIKLGELLIDAAVDEAKPAINDALDSAFTELAIMRQFHDECEEVEHLRNDIAQRSNDMNRAIRAV